MADGNGKVQLTLEEGSEAVFVRGGIKVEFNAGGIVVYQNNAPVYPAANDSAPQAAAAPGANAGPQVGDKQADGTVFAGLSPDTNQPMYARSSDEPNTYKWKKAMEYAARFEGNGHPAGAFRVPSKDELNVLFRNRAKIGGFNETGSGPAGWYWSSTEGRAYAGCAWDQRFDDGDRGWDPKSYESSLRLVRS
jgi:hypothetical protein